LTPEPAAPAKQRGGENGRAKTPPRLADNENALTAGLEVVSASALLNDDERALLAGDATAPRAPKGKAPRRDDSRGRKSNHHDEDEEGVARIFVDAGKRDQVYKDDFLETLRQGGVRPDDIIFVKIRETHSFVGVEPGSVDVAVTALDGKEVAGLEVSAEKARPRKD
jgi:hypothetical protein